MIDLLEDYPFKVTLPSSQLHLVQDMADWCVLNVGPRHIKWGRAFGKFLFKREADAVSFTMTWL